MKPVYHTLWLQLEILRMENDMSVTCKCGRIYEERQYPKCPECWDVNQMWNEAEV